MDCTAKEIVDNLRRIYSMLEDEESKETYLCRLNYLITGDKRHMDYIIGKYLPTLPAWKEDALDRLAESISEESQVVLYGAGFTAGCCLSSFKKCKRFVGFCDRDPEKQTKGYLGEPVISPNVLLKDYRDAVIVISTTEFVDEVEQFLLENGISNHQIMRIEQCFPSALPEEYFGMDFLHFGDHEVFVDGGSFSLETTCLFLKHCKQVDKVFAFEPDPENFARCKEAKHRKGLFQVELVPCGTWSENATVSFQAESNPGSRIAPSGKSSVRLTSIDNVVGTEPVTFIKLDVEGAELESLKGAKKTIQKNRPQLAICLYHKPEDMIDLPLYIKSLVSDYRMYVRHIENVTAGTVLYAV